MLKKLFIILFTTLTLQLNTQVPCDVDLIGLSDYCVLDTRETIYASDISARIAFEYPYLNPQGPYDLQVNGINFENKYLWSLEALCCGDMYASDFGFDFEKPGSYQISLESISHLDNDCDAVVGSPIFTKTISVLPPPTFDFQFTCQQNGDVKLDVILTSQILSYIDLFFITFTGSSSNTVLINALPGDTIHTEIRALSTNESHIMTIRDCVSNIKFHTSEYIHNCTSCADNTAPTALCKNISLNLSNQSLEITHKDINDNSFDDCGIVSYGITETSFDCSDIGQNVVVLEVADGAGNISECTSTVTVNDVSNTCASCYSLDKSPTIEFSHTELDDDPYVKIWYRITDFNQYAHLNPRLNSARSNNYIFSDFEGELLRESIITGSFLDNRFDQIDEFMYFRINPNSLYQDCDRIETNLTFTDDFCDVSYKSNSLILNCDNDNDGFTMDIDCNDNNPLQYPGAIEICDGVDNNCDGQVDEGYVNIFGNCCPFELNVHQTNIVAGTYKADNRIYSEGRVASTQVEMRAGAEVNLSSGFEVTAGSIFHAHIAPCN